MRWPVGSLKSRPNSFSSRFFSSGAPFYLMIFVQGIIHGIRVGVEHNLPVPI
jgi:hypothetical protein